MNDATNDSETNTFAQQLLTVAFCTMHEWETGSRCHPTADVRNRAEYLRRQTQQADHCAAQCGMSLEGTNARGCTLTNRDSWNLEVVGDLPAGRVVRSCELS